jgi:hypothetical protein
MVLVRMRDEYARDMPAKGLERAEVRVNNVDPKPSVVERDSTIDEEHGAPLLQGEAIHADLTEAPEGADAQAAARFGAHPRRL